MAYTLNLPQQCPPAEARTDQLSVFRLVSNTPVSDQDFLPSIIENPDRKFAPEDLCNAYGVSVFKNIDDVKKRRSRYKGFRNKKIVTGIIGNQDGLVLETYSDSHVTWWTTTQVPHKNFSEVDENVST